jgi:hypothetical protein
MNDINKEFGGSGAAGGESSPYAHPLADQILQECSALLMEIPEGKRLLDFAREKDLKIHVITGKEPSFQSGDKDNTFLICPANTKAVDLYEMAGNLAIAIRDAEQPYDGIPKPIPGAPGIDLPRATFQHFLDIIYEMCKIGVEFEDVKKSSKIVDLIEKLGHGDIYREVRSGKTKQDIAPLLAEVMKV